VRPSLIDLAAAVALAIAPAALAAGCGSPSTCAELGPASGLGAKAARLRLEVYAASAQCSGGQVSSTEPPLQTADFTPAAPAAIDLPAGAFVVHMLAYQDAAMTVVIGEGCSLATISANQSTCLSLSLTPTGCTLLSHDNGVGSFYQSCAPLGTFDSTSAMLACTSAMLPGASCASRACSGGGSDQAICAKSGTDCTCWTYTGAGAGTLRNPAGGGCDCGRFGDPTWK
jgi:hypothetical protein